jgi:hypothetical protein
MRMYFYLKTAKSLGIKHSFKKIKRKFFGNLLYHQPIIRYLRKNYSYVYKDLKIEKSNKESETFYIWVMWWQGEEYMPDSIKICYRSIIENAGEGNVRLITENNCTEYIQLPAHILNKFKAGVITITHLSDIIRFTLLDEYGGIWLDSTTLVTNSNLSTLKNRFFTLKFRTHSQSTPSIGRWSGTIISGNRHDLYFHLMRELFSEYWRKEETLVKYLLIDYFVLLLYTDVEYVRNLINGVKWSESNYKLKEIINSPYNESNWKVLTSRSHFHTLDRRASHFSYTSKGFITYYGFLLGKYIH